MLWAFHKIIPFLLVNTVLTIVVEFVGGPLVIILTIIVVIAIPLLALCQIWHVNTLCEICARNFPLDASATAERKKTFLWLFHHFELRLILIGLILAFDFTAPHFLSHNFSTIVVNIVGLSLLPFIYSSGIHFQLQPWCPYCRHGKGGHDTNVLDPEPDPAGVGF